MDYTWPRVAITPVGFGYVAHYKRARYPICSRFKRLFRCKISYVHVLKPVFRMFILAHPAFDPLGA